MGSESLAAPARPRRRPPDARSEARWTPAGSGLALAFVLCAALGAAPKELPDPEPIPDGAIEIIAGGERRIVPSSIATPGTDAKRESGVLPIRGDVVGPVEPRFEIDRHTVSGPARARLRLEIDAIVRVYREAFGVPVEPDLARELSILNPIEDVGPGAPPPIRVAYRHGLERMPEHRRAKERVLMARARHETSHAIVSARFPDAPWWLEEGLAVALEGIRPGQDAIEARLAESRVEPVARVRRADARLDTQALLALERDAWDALDPAVARDVQAELGSLLLLLLREQEFRAAVGSLLSGDQSLDLIEDDPVAFDREWREWLRSSMRITLLEPPPPVPEAKKPRRRIRGLRCVPGAFLGRPVLFCSRRVFTD